MPRLLRPIPNKRSVYTSPPPFKKESSDSDQDNDWEWEVERILGWREDRQEYLDTIQKIAKVLTDGGIRFQCDTRTHYSPGWKFAEYELRGFSLRIDFGLRDAAKNTVAAVRHDTGE